MFCQFAVFHDIGRFQRLNYHRLAFVNESLKEFALKVDASVCYFFMTFSDKQPSLCSIGATFSLTGHLILPEREYIKQQAITHPDAKRLMRIRGVAEIIATAAVSFAGDGSGYNGARHFSANLGLVPKEFSSGGKVVKLSK